MPWLPAFLLASAFQTIATHRAQHRPAEELLRVAETALGAEGEVALDERTGTLVLNGSAEAVRRTLDLLETLDRPIEQVVVTSEIREVSERKLLEANVVWRADRDGLRIGTLPGSRSGIAAEIGAGSESVRSRSRSMLKVLSGGSGRIATGEALPFVYEPYFGTRAVELVPAETGFEVRPSVLAGGDIRLDIRPFSGRFEETGALRYTAAETSVTVSPGETLVIAESADETTRSRADLGGASRERSGAHAILLVTAELEGAERAR